MSQITKFRAEDRVDWTAKPGPDWGLVEDAAPAVETFEAEVDLPLVTYSRPVKVTEPGALVDGVEECLRIAQDPGEGTVILGEPKLRTSHRLAIGEAHFWTGSGLRSLSLVTLSPRNIGPSWGTGTPHPVPGPGEWSDKLDRLTDAGHQSRPLLGVDLFAALDDMSGNRTLEDLDVLLVDPIAQDAVRAAGILYLRDIVDDLTAKDSNHYHRAAAPLVGLTEDDIFGPRGAEALRDALRDRLADLCPSEVLETVRDLLPDAVLG